jgi:hypothetical protein
MPGREHPVIQALTLTFGFVVFDRNAMSFLEPFVPLDLRLNNTQPGMLSSALALTGAASRLAIRCAG